MHNLLSLDEDVFLLIVSYIDGQNALSLSLASKRAYDRAGFRIPAIVRCRTPAELRRLHNYILAPWNGSAASRAHYIEELSIGPLVFLRKTPPAHVTADFSQAHLLGDILVEADRIRVLSLDKIYGCMRKDPRIAGALCAMSRLADCHLRTVVDSTLTALQSMQTPSLTLDYYTLSGDALFVDTDSLSEEPITLPALLSTLSHFRLLRILKLYSFLPSTPLVQIENPSVPYPQLPSIRHIELRCCSVYALDITLFCPNLTALVLSFQHDGSSATTPPALPSHRRSLSLPRLMLRRARDFTWIQNYVGSVDRLEIIQPFDVHEDPHPTWSQYLDLPAETLDVISRTSPVGLYLSVQMYPQLSRAQDFWTSLSQQATRLRSLEIKVGGKERNDDYAWIGTLPDALAPIRQRRILCLRVLVPAITRGPPRGPKFKEWLDRAREREKLRVLALNDLPQRLIDVMPSLRYLAIGDALESEDLKDDGKPVRKELDELRLVIYVGQTRWWKIKREDGRVEVEEIREEVGEEAQRLIERPDLEEGGSLEVALGDLASRWGCI